MIGHKLRQAGSLAALLTAATFSLGPCTSDMVDEFREVASDDIATGLKNIASGVIDGFFSAIDPGTDAVSSGSVGTTPSQSSTSS